MASPQRVFASFRLPWHFKVGNQRRRQYTPAAPAIPANVTPPSWNEYGSPIRQQSMVIETPTSRLCATAALSGPTLEPLILSPPVSSPLSEGGHQAVSFVPSSNTQTLAARDLGAKEVGEPAQRKRGLSEADLDDEGSRESTGGRRVRPRLEQWNDPPSTRTDRPLSPSANQVHPRPFTTATATEVTQETTLVPSSDGSSNAPATSVTPWVSQLAPSLHKVQGHQSSARPVELVTTVLRAANPRCGPVSGGLEIWLEMDDLPTNFQLYAKFGDKVTPTVSSTFHPLSSSNLHISLFGISVRCHVYFPPQVTPVV